MTMIVTSGAGIIGSNFIFTRIITRECTAANEHLTRELICAGEVA